MRDAMMVIGIVISAVLLGVILLGAPSVIASL